MSLVRDIEFQGRNQSLMRLKMEGVVMKTWIEGNIFAAPEPYGRWYLLDEVRGIESKELFISLDVAIRALRVGIIPGRSVLMSLCQPRRVYFNKRQWHDEKWR